MDAIHLDDLTFRIIRSARRKTVEIGIERDGSLVLRAPETTTDARLESFATKKRMWVREKLARKNALVASRRPPAEFVAGEGFPYLGRSYRLAVVAQQREPLKLVDGRFRLLRSEVGRGREHFVDWYTAHAAKWLAQRILTWVPRLGAKEARVEVLDLGYRWGSCGSGRVNFNWSTITLPPTIVDYVIVHELVHLHHANHGPQFRSTLARAMPDHAARKRWLAEHGSEYGL